MNIRHLKSSTSNLTSFVQSQSCSLKSLKRSLKKNKAPELFSVVSKNSAKKKESSNVTRELLGETALFSEVRQGEILGWSKTISDVDFSKAIFPPSKLVDFPKLEISASWVSLGFPHPPRFATTFSPGEGTRNGRRKRLRLERLLPYWLMGQIISGSSRCGGYFYPVIYKVLDTFQVVCSDFFNGIIIKVL